MSHLWLGVRLAARGGRARARLTAVTSGVALGVLLLLSVASAGSIRDERLARVQERDAYLRTDGVVIGYAPDRWSDHRIERFTVAGDPSAPAPPGLSNIPAAGTSAVSPALAALLRDPMAAELAKRYPQPTATIRDAGLAGSRELVAWVGVDAADAADAVRLFRAADAFPALRNLVPTNAPAPDDAPSELRSYMPVALAAIAALLVVFLTTCIRVAAASQGKRISALGLAGATPSQLRLVVAGELMIATIAGTLIGAAAFVPLRLVSEGWVIADVSWFAADVTPGAYGALVILGVPILGHLIAQRGARQSIRRPLWIRKSGQPAIASTPRLAVTAFGLLLLLVVAVPQLRPNLSSGAVTTAGVIGLPLCLVGLPLSFPVILRSTAALVARRARRHAVQLAARSVEHDPMATSRNVVAVAAAVVVLGVFSGFLGVERETGLSRDNAARWGALRLVRGLPGSGAADLLESTDGVEGVVPMTFRLIERPEIATGRLATRGAWLASCEDVRRVLAPERGFCAGADGGARVLNRGAQEVVCESAVTGPRVASPRSDSPPPAAKPVCRSAPFRPGEKVIIRRAGDGGAVEVSASAEITVPAATIRHPDDFAIPGFDQVDDQLIIPPDHPSLRVDPPAPESWLVRTDGTESTDQRLRTVTAKASALASITSSADEVDNAAARGGFGRAVMIAGAALALSLAVAALAVAGLDSSWDRRRTTAVLCCVGVPTGSLRRTQAAAVISPILLAAALGTAVGALADIAFDRMLGVPASLDAALPLAAVLVAGLTLPLGLLLAVKGMRDSDLGVALRSE